MGENTWEPGPNLSDSAMREAMKFDKRAKETKQLRNSSEALLFAQQHAAPTLPVVHPESKSKTKPLPQSKSQSKSTDLFNWDLSSMVKFMDVERVDVSKNDQKIIDYVTSLRKSGIPVVLTGSSGWAGFAAEWIEEEKVVKSKKSNSNNDNDNNTKFTLSTDQIIKDIGNEDVPVIKESYNELDPIHGKIQISTFLEKCWLTNSKHFYLHQWQFPLSPTAGHKLCHKSAPLSVFGDDLLKYWLDLPQVSERSVCWTVPEQPPLNEKMRLAELATVSNSECFKTLCVTRDDVFRTVPEQIARNCHSHHPHTSTTNVLFRPALHSSLKNICASLSFRWAQCKGDSPLQYIFMGAGGTFSKLHQDNGGLAITIAPLYGEKEVSMEGFFLSHPSTLSNEALTCTGRPPPPPRTKRCALPNPPPCPIHSVKTSIRWSYGRFSDSPFFCLFFSFNFNFN